MIARLALATAIALTPLTGALAQGSRQLASDLAMIIASETSCGLTLDQTAIAALITARVDPGDLKFPKTLAGMIGYYNLTLPDMTESARTAHCTAVARNALFLNLVQP